MTKQTALKDPGIPSRLTFTSSVLLSEVKAFFAWWYVEMPTWYVGLIQRVALVCDDTFSVSLLIRTFFVPWRRDYSWVGRFMGILIRIIYIPITLLLTLTVLAVLLAIAIAWAVIPAVSIYFLIMSPFLR